METSLQPLSSKTVVHEEPSLQDMLGVSTPLFSFHNTRVKSPAHFDPSHGDKLAWVAAGVSFLVGVTLIGLVVAERAADTTPPIGGAKNVGSPVGWLGAGGAIVVFGSSQLLMRLGQFEPIREVARPGLFACFSALGNGLTNLILSIVFRSTGLLKTAPSGESILFGFLGALDINVVQLMAAAACQALGVGAAPAIWCGIGMGTSFVWGAAVFREPVNNVIGAIVALIALALGIGIVASAQTTLPSKIKAFLLRRAESPQFGQPSQSVLLKGLVLTLLVGLFDGSLMVPYKLFVTRADVSGPAESELTYVYIESFGIMVLCFFPVLLVVQGLLWRAREGTLAGLIRALRLTMWPGMWTGVFWALGNACSVHASEYLGVALGFPLTQCCVVICAIWGVVLFGEMRSCQAKVACALGIGVVLVGAVLLSQFGQ